MTEPVDFKWYKNKFNIVWEDGESEVVESHHGYERQSLPQRGPRIELKEKDNIECTVLPYLRPWISKESVEVNFYNSVDRVLNFDKIKSIDHIRSEPVEETIEP